MSICENNIDKSLKPKKIKKQKIKKLEQPNECTDINSNIIRKISNKCTKGLILTFLELKYCIIFFG